MIQVSYRQKLLEINEHEFRQKRYQLKSSATSAFGDFPATTSCKFHRNSLETTCCGWKAKKQNLERRSESNRSSELKILILGCVEVSFKLWHFRTVKTPTQKTNYHFCYLFDNPPQKRYVVWAPAGNIGALVLENSDSENPDAFSIKILFFTYRQPKKNECTKGTLLRWRQEIPEKEMWNHFWREISVF